MSEIKLEPWKLKIGAIAAGVLLLVIAAFCGGGGSGGGGGQQDSRPQASPFKQQKEYERVIVVAVDLSGSFLPLMTNGGKAYEFMGKLVSRYMRAGTDDRIVIAQISGNDRPLIFDGTALDIRRTFGSEAAFNKFLRSKADPNASRVHDGISDSMKYILRYPGVADGKVKSAVIILSDMDDNHSKKGSDKRLNGLLRDYAAVGGSVGIYFCDEQLEEHWDARLQKAGFAHYIVSAGIKANPELPEIE